ncbi:MAG: TRCF domain-containing protein, partial [Chloroflexota bacterium]|nr:TRCF domain-containing protein [Chloroflexota bacterium]
RFGPLPLDVQNLMYQLRLKALARDAGVRVIGVQGDRLALWLSKGVYANYANRDKLRRLLKGRASVSRRSIWLPQERGWREELAAVLKEMARAAAVDG